VSDLHQTNEKKKVFFIISQPVTFVERNPVRFLTFLVEADRMTMLPKNRQNRENDWV
jgi:hypothetical protein